MKLYRIAANDIVPEKIGTTPIPSNNIRLYHYTRGNPEDIRREGLKLSHAQGETYGEPNMIWASSVAPDTHSKNIVEFSVPVNSDMALEHPRQGEKPEEWMKGYHHVGFFRDISPAEIIAVHEPWHETYRYITDKPDMIEKVLSGEFDNLTEDKYPDEFKAIQAVKAKYRDKGEI